jgi:hypothetical protein
MRMCRRTRRILIGLVGALLAACGSSKSATPPNRSGVGASSTTLAGAPDPNAPEQLTPGDIPDNQVFVTYTSATGGYSLSYPQGWARRDSANGTHFSQYLNTIDVATTAATSAPTISSARSDATTTLASLPGFKLIAVNSVTRKAGPAVHIVYNATSPVDAVTGKTVTLQVERYQFWHHGVLLDMTLSSAKGSDNVDPWRIVTDSLTWK